jgi:hypothetical protein
LLPSRTSPGRSQIGTSLSFHLFFAVLGVGLPLMMLVAEGMHLRTGDERLAPGFATETRLDGADRTVTCFNGSVLRERLVDLDDQAHRVAWSIIDGPYTHHNGSAQVFARRRRPGPVRVDRRSAAR